MIRKLSLQIQLVSALYIESVLGFTLFPESFIAYVEKIPLCPIKENSQGQLSSFLKRRIGVAVSRSSVYSSRKFLL